jgi:uncharacterized protein YuzE
MTDLKVDYYRDNDRLYAAIGQPQAALSVEVQDGVYVRVTPARQVCGIEVLDCSTHFRVDPDEIDQAFVSGLLERFSSQALDLFDHRR